MTKSDFEKWFPIGIVIFSIAFLISNVDILFYEPPSYPDLHKIGSPRATIEYKPYIEREQDQFNFIIKSQKPECCQQGDETTNISNVKFPNLEECKSIPCKNQCHDGYCNALMCLQCHLT